MKVHNRLPQGILSAALTKALGDSRDEGSLERYSETLDAIIDLWGRPEFAILRGEILFSVPTAIPAVAAEFGGAAIINPINSGLLALVTGMVRAGGVNSFFWGLVTEAALVATYTVTPLKTVIDGRHYRPLTFGGGATGLNIGTGSDAASQLTANPVFDQVTTTAAGSDEKTFRVPIILRPGQAAIIEATAVLVGASVTLYGWARKAGAGELL